MTELNCNTKLSKKTEHFTEVQRGKLEVYWNEEKNTNKSDLARKLGVFRHTIRNELNRGMTTQVQIIKGKKVYFEIYSAEKGFAVYKKNRSRCRNPKKTELFRPFLDEIDEYLKSGEKAVDECVNEARREKQFEHIPCTNTVYTYIDLGLMKTKNIDLPEKVSRKPRGTNPPKKNKTNLGKSIEERPKAIETREEFGHWEIDCVLGLKEKEDNVLLSLVERKTRLTLLYKLDDKTVDSVNYAIKQLMQTRGLHAPGVIKTITADNGSEFAGLDAAFSASFDIYFTHPYASYERGTNERHNRMLRRRIPKGKAIASIRRSEIQSVEDWMNNKRRKILVYDSPRMRFEQELVELQKIV